MPLLGNFSEMSDTYLDEQENFVNQLIEQQKKRLCTDPNKLFGYMWYLIRKACKLNQTEMGAYFGKFGGDKGLSKSAYSKVENGQTDINFDLVFSFSLNTGIDFDHLYQLFSYIIKKADSNGCSFMTTCGHLGLGSHNGMFLSYQNVSKEYWYTDLKDYYKFFLPSDLESIHDIIYDMFKKSEERKKAQLEWIAEQDKDNFDFDDAAQHNFDILAEEALEHLQKEKNGKSK